MRRMVVDIVAVRIFSGSELTYKTTSSLSSQNVYGELEVGYEEQR